MDRYRKGLVALSADPVTVGHIHLIETARSHCHSLVVLVANNDAKKNSYLFALTERMQMVRRAISHLTHVEVYASDGLLVDAFLEYGCDILFRGIRNEADMRYEEEQAAGNAYIYPRMESRVSYLKASPLYAGVSSTIVRAYASHHVDVTPLVPTQVKAQLEERLHGQYKIGITGVIASGKSYVAQALCAQAQSWKMPTSIINIDELIRELYAEQSDGAQSIREELAQLLGEDVLTSDRRGIDRQRAAAKLFDQDAPTELIRQVSELVRPHVDRLYRKALKQARGLVIVEWAQMAENNMSGWTNHNVIVVEAKDRAPFIRNRGLSSKRLKSLETRQWSTDRKIEELNRRVAEYNHGWIHRFQNDADPVNFNAAIAVLLKLIVDDVYPDLVTLR